MSMPSDTMYLIERLINSTQTTTLVMFMLFNECSLSTLLKISLAQPDPLPNAKGSGDTA